MSVLWTAADAAEATGGRATTDWQATGVSIDTRTIAEGELFVALKDQRDGHDFVADALAKGAAAALVSRVPDGVSEDAPLLIVEDVLEGLRGLGTAGRARTKAQVIGITGSVGKTSTKEMLRAVLGAQGKVHAAEKSFNNHWGVPLTLARMPADADFAVIEIGMNAPGEIAPLSRLARPHVAIVTTVAAAHLAAFDDLSGIAREKGSIFEGLETGGCAVLNADVETSPILRAAAEGHRIRSFGVSEGADWQMTGVTMGEDNTVVQLRAGDTPVVFKLDTPGKHFALNAVAGLAAVDAAGGDLGQGAVTLSGWSPYQGRGTRETIIYDDGDPKGLLTLIDDAYNANPTSLGASLEVLAVTQPRNTDGEAVAGRRVAVLGDMLELGPQEVAMHAGLADHPAFEEIAQVHCVGPLMRNLWEALPADKQGMAADTPEDLIAQIKDLLQPADVVLVKGSLGSRVSRCVDALRKLGQAKSSGGQEG